MTLDPQAKAFLDAVNNPDRVPFHKLGVATARDVYADRSDQLAPPWAALFKVDNRTFVSAGYNIPVRIYTPIASEQALPILLFYHGGGMVIGTLDGYDNLCRQLAKQSRCIVVSVDYRLAPEHKFPAAVDDAYQALLWVQAHGQDFGGDTAAIAIGGDSAGASLAAVVALLARDAGLPTLKAQLLIYPATAAYEDMPSQYYCAKGYFMERPTVLWFHKLYIRSDQDRQDFRYAPLVAQNHSGLPPALVIVAGYDPLRDEGIAYAEALKADGVDVELTEYPGMFHPFVSFAGVLDEGKKAITQTANFLANHCRD